MIDTFRMKHKAKSSSSNVTYQNDRILLVVWNFERLSNHFCWFSQLQKSISTESSRCGRQRCYTYLVDVFRLCSFSILTGNGKLDNASTRRCWINTCKSQYRVRQLSIVRWTNKHNQTENEVGDTRKIQFDETMLITWTERWRKWIFWQVQQRYQQPQQRYNGSKLVSWSCLLVG